MQKMIANMETNMINKLTALKPTSNTGEFGGNAGDGGGANVHKDLTGRYYDSICGYCGVQLSPGRCDQTCHRYLGAKWPQILRVGINKKSFYF